MAVRIMSVLSGLVLAAVPLMAQAPPGWRTSSETQVRVDPTVAHSGKASGLVRGSQADDFVTLRQSIKTDDFRGKRVRMSSYVRTALVSGTASMWMRVDGPGASGGVAFDNMNGRPIRGTTEWTRYDIVLDVPQESSVIVFGVMVTGQGDVWFDDVTLDAVGSDVPSTNTMDEPAHDHSRTDKEKADIIETRRAAPVKPRNLGFEEQKSL